MTFCVVLFYMAVLAFHGAVFYGMGLSLLLILEIYLTSALEGNRLRICNKE